MRLRGKFLIAVSLVVLIFVTNLACVNIIEPKNHSSSVASKPAAKLHNIPIKEIHENSAYWNLCWQGKYPEMEKKAREINQQYFKTHTYITGQTDCNDMAIDIWNMLQTAGITGIIVVGNVKLTEYTFAQCNHAWLLIYEKRDSGPAALALETTNGQIYGSKDTGNNYWAGFCYTKPSDLRTDLGNRW